MDEFTMDEQIELGKEIENHRHRLAASFDISMQHAITLLQLRDLKMSTHPGSFPKELFKNSLLLDTQLSDKAFRRICLKVLLCIDKETIKSLCSGAIHHPGQEDKWETLPPISNTAGERNPIVYGYFHKNSEGYSPTKREYTAIVEAVETYLDDTNEDNDECREAIDTIVGGESIYSPRYIRSPQCTVVGKEWVKAMKARLANVFGEDEDEPVPWTVSEVGYTKRTMERRDEHRKHHDSKSNALMCLVDAASRWVYGDKYAMRYAVLFHCYEPSQAPYAEHLLTHICGAYVVEGGLNGAIAGKSHGFIESLSVDAFEKNLAWALTQTPLERQAREEKEKWVEWRRRFDAEREHKAEMARLEDEIKQMELLDRELSVELKELEQKAAQHEAELQESVDTRIARMARVEADIVELEALDEFLDGWLELEDLYASDDS